MSKAGIFLILTATLRFSGALAAEPVRPVSLEGRDAAGRPFRLESERGRVLAVTLVSRYTQRQVERINDALGACARPGEVSVVTVVDFIGIPHLFHGYARRKVLEGTQRSRIRFLVDEQGLWRSYFQARPDQRIDILVIDRAGRLRAHFVGEEQLGEALRLIDSLRGAAGGPRSWPSAVRSSSAPLPTT